MRDMTIMAVMAVVAAAAAVTLLTGWMTDVAYADNENYTAAADFRNLPAEEKEYAEPMNILGKTVRIFNGMICLEEYCKVGDRLPVYIDGAVGLNTKDPIKLEIQYCGHWAGVYDVGSVSISFCEGGNTPMTIRADNEGGGSFHAEWNVRKSHTEGLYEVTATADGKVLQVGNTMADVINGNINSRFLILDNTEPVQFTQVTAEDVTIRVLDIRYGETSGIVDYEICAKRDLKNPTFEIKSDSKIGNVSNEIELKEGECYEGKYTILAKTPSTIFIPLAWSGDADTGDMESQKADNAEYDIPDWVRQTAEWWVQGLIPDEVYIQSLEYLIKVGIINVGTS